MNEFGLSIFHKRIRRCINNLLSFKQYIHKCRSDEDFFSVDWHDSIINELEEAILLISEYNSSKIKELNKVRLIKINENLINLTLEEVVICLNNVLREIQDVDSYLDNYLRPNLSESEKGRIELLRKDLGNLETDEKTIKNLEIALMEAESTHELACGIISARVIVERLEKIEGHNDEDRLARIVEMGIIDNTESSKFSSKAFLDASRSARNAVSHKDSWFPNGAESLSLLSSAFRMAEWVSKYFNKIGEEKNGKEKKKIS